MNADQIVDLIAKHGYHKPTNHGRNMGLYCRCGRYMPGGLVRGEYITDIDMWRRHVKAVVNRALKELA